MSLPLTRYKRKKIFYPQQGKSQNNLILRCEKVILFWTATQSDLTFLSDGKYFFDSSIMLDKDRSLVIRLSSPSHLDTRLRGHYPLILIMWDSEYSAESKVCILTNGTLGQAHGQSPLWAPGGRLAWRTISRVISMRLLWPFQLWVTEVTTLKPRHHMWVRSAES